MPRPKHYVPEIRKNIVTALYFESKAKGVPMTVLTNQILADNLKDTGGWKRAMAMQERGPTYLISQPLTTTKGQK